MKTQNIFLLMFLLAFSCQTTETKTKNGKVILGDDATVKETANGEILYSLQGLPLGKIQLPEGFKISVFAEVENARSLAISDDERTIFVGNRQKDKVYALQDLDGDGMAERKYVIAEGLDTPNGVAFKDGDLYVAEVSRILKFPNIEANLDNPPKPVVVTDKFPTDKHHGWKFIAFWPDDKLYVPVGAPCNICLEENPIYSSITRMNADGSDLEVYAHGVRNSVGFDWHPNTKEFWFTENGRDRMNDTIPGDELNYAPKKDMHFGFPYCHQGNVADPEFGNLKDCSEFTPPKLRQQAHVAALGMRFYTGNMFPEKYKNAIFIAQHGSWNRSNKVGYQVKVAYLNGNEVTEFEDFAKGWLQGESDWGRPVDVQQLKDGSLLISDDKANAVYRVWYEN